jgi:hypothetical protein
MWFTHRTQSRLQFGGPTNVVVPGAGWKYSDQGLNLGTAWTAPEFDDHAWPVGTSPLGYGDASGVWPATTNRYGPNNNDKYITTYYRHPFVLTHPAASATLELQCDDGAIVYLNGSEVFRVNLTNGLVDYRTLALSSIGGSTETNWHATNLSTALMRLGTNLLAAEVHQATNNSSDLFFNLLLKATLLGR